MTTQLSPKVRRTNNEAGQSGQVSPIRVLIGLLILALPIAALIALMIVVLVTYSGNKIKGWQITTLGSIGAAVMLYIGQVKIYIHTYSELATQILANLNPTNDTASISILELINTQLPFAITLGLIISGIVLTIRERYTPTWKKETEKQQNRPPSDKKIIKAKAKQNQTILKTPPATTIKELTIPIGIDADTCKPINMNAEALRTHGVIIGPTGLGKTQAIQRIISCLTIAPAAQNLKIPILIIDMKADEELSAFLQTIATETGREFYKITVDPQTSTHTYNPLEGLNADETADNVYETLFASDPTLNTHYANLSRRLLQIASQTLIDLHQKDKEKYPQNLQTLMTLLSPEILQTHIPNVTYTTSINLTQYLNDLTNSDNLKDAGDVRDRVATIINTNAGKVLQSGGLNLQTAIENGDIICFSLQAAGAPETARTIGSLAIQDTVATLGRLAAKNWGKTNMCPILLDEFSALRTRKVEDLYARARSAGGACLLSTQDLQADLNAVSPEFASTIQTNANNWLILKQNRAEMAEIISNDLGTIITQKNTVQIQDQWDILGGTAAASGMGSIREVDEYILHPNQIKTLPQGAAYLITKTPTGTLNQYEAQTQINRIHINAPKTNQQPKEQEPITTPNKPTTNISNKPTQFQQPALAPKQPTPSHTPPGTKPTQYQSPTPPQQPYTPIPNPFTTSAQNKTLQSQEIEEETEDAQSIHIEKPAWYDEE